MEGKRADADVRRQRNVQRTNQMNDISGGFGWVPQSRYAGAQAWLGCPLPAAGQPLTRSARTGIYWLSRIWAVPYAWQEYKTICPHEHKIATIG